MNNFIQDGDGDQDEKRLAGLVVTAIGLIMAMTFFVVGLCSQKELSVTLLSLIEFLIGTGLAILFGSVVADGFAKKLKNQSGE